MIAMIERLPRDAERSSERKDGGSRGATLSSTINDASRSMRMRASQPQPSRLQGQFRGGKVCAQSRYRRYCTGIAVVYEESRVKNVREARQLELEQSETGGGGAALKAECFPTLPRNFPPKISFGSTWKEMEMGKIAGRKRKQMRNRVTWRRV